MLLRENFRGRHPQGLPAMFDGAQRRKPGDHGFPRAHVPLHQPLHRLIAAQVGVDFLEYALLRTGELERQELAHALAQRAARAAQAYRGARGTRLFAQSEAKLQVKQLVEDHRSVCR